MMVRPKKCKVIDICLEHDFFSCNLDTSKEIVLDAEELQAIKLADIDGLSCIEGAKKMGIGKSTFANIYNNAHKKIADALIKGYNIKFSCE